MATHAEIVERSGADPAVAEKLGAKSHQVRDWRLRNSIPSEWWEDFSRHGFATLDELAAAAKARGRGSAPPSEAAA